MTAINGIYDEAYFKKYKNRSNGLWWSSANRSAEGYGAGVSEILELDLSRNRTVNYLSFDVLKKPIDIKIEYDAIGLSDLSQYPDERRWVEVSPLSEDMPYDDSVDYNTDVNPWKNCEFYFTAPGGKTVFTRRLRITFMRRNENWPTEQTAPFPWSIDVNNVRVMRYAMTVEQMRGTIIDTMRFDDVIDLSDENANEAIQRFELPAEYERLSPQEVNLNAIDGFTTTDVYPRILGFSFYGLPEAAGGTAEIVWSLYDITRADNLIAKGRESISVPPVPFIDGGDSESIIVQPEPIGKWFDIHFDYPVETNPTSKYEIRISSTRRDVLKKIYTTSVIDEDQYANLFLNSASQGLVWKKKTTLTYKIIGDVGSSGTDILGNQYREALRINRARNVLDKKIYSFWVSNPNPSPEGVEALYFDIRSNVGGVYTQSIIDGLEIDTGTPGVMMNIYYTSQPIEGGAPRTTEEWESMMWTPVRQSFILNRKEKITFPTFRANFVCLEFYNLQPFPFNLPTFPVLPSVRYKQFPEWVVSDSLTQENTVFPINTGAQTVSVPFYDLVNRPEESDPVPAVLPQTAEEKQNDEGFGTVNSRTASGISILGNSWQNAPATNADTSGLLGRATQKAYSQKIERVVPVEAAAYPRQIDSAEVSNLNNRIQNIRNEHRPTLFNRVCAHNYDVYEGHFNKKAYIVSVSEVSFFRKDYTTRADDKIIRDILADPNVSNSPLIETNNWKQQEESRIAIGEEIYVSYTVGEIEYTDEKIFFEDSSAQSASLVPVSLQYGGAMATGVDVYTARDRKGQRYVRDVDFVIVYDADAKINKIARNPLHYRLTVGQVTHSKDQYVVEGFSSETVYASSAENVERTFHALKGSISNVSEISGNLYVPLGAIPDPVELEAGIAPEAINSKTTIYATLIST